MKALVLPFTCIKRHFEGEMFAPVPAGNDFQLESINFVLVGSNGNAYKFKTYDNAQAWIESNLIRASKEQVTAQTHIDALVIKNSQIPRDYLQLEIETLQLKNAGFWFTSNDIFLDGGNAIN